MANRIRWFPLLVGGSALLGCADRGEEEAQADWVRPTVYSTHPVVYWTTYDKRIAVGTSKMHFYGNRAEEKLEISIAGPTPESSGEKHIVGRQHFFFDYYEHESPAFNQAVPGSCGNVANLKSLHSAFSSFFIQYKGFGALPPIQYRVTLKQTFSRTARRRKRMSVLLVAAVAATRAALSA